MSYRDAGEQREYSRRFSTVGLALTVLIAARLLAQIVLELVCRIIDPAIAAQWWYPWLLSFLPLYGVALPLAYFVLSAVPTSPHHELYTRRLPDGTAVETEKPAFRLSWLFLAWVIGMGYMYIGNLVGQGVMNALSEWVGFNYGNSLTSLVEESPLWMTLLGSVILAPLGEEFMFRKLLMDRTRRFGDTVSILLSAFFFALFHGNLYQFFYAFLLGLVLGYLYAYTGKLRWSVILHMMINFMGSIVPSLLQSLVDMEALSSADPTVVEAAILAQPLGYLLLLVYSYLIYGWMIAAMVLTIFGCVRRRICLARGEVILRPGERLGIVLGNPGMLMAYAAGMLMLLMALLPMG